MSEALKEIIVPHPLIKALRAKLADDFQRLYQIPNPKKIPEITNLNAALITLFASDPKDFYPNIHAIFFGPLRAIGEARLELTLTSLQNQFYLRIQQELFTITPTTE